MRQINRTKSNKSLITCIHGRDQENWDTCQMAEILTLNINFFFFFFLNIILRQKRKLGVVVWDLRGVAGNSRGDEKAWETSVCWARHRKQDPEWILMSRPCWVPTTTSSPSSLQMSLVIALSQDQALYLPSSRQLGGRSKVLPESSGPWLFAAWNNLHAEEPHFGVANSLPLHIGKPKKFTGEECFYTLKEIENRTEIK